jgi:hypothetical protein
VTTPADWFPGDPLRPGMAHDSYDWTGDGMDGDGEEPVWDDVLDGPVYPARPFCDHNGHCYEERLPGSAFCAQHPHTATKEAA